MKKITSITLLLLAILSCGKDNSTSTVSNVQKNSSATYDFESAGKKHNEIIVKFMSNRQNASLTLSEKIDFFLNEVNLTAEQRSSQKNYLMANYVIPGGVRDINTIDIKPAFQPIMNRVKELVTISVKNQKSSIFEEVLAMQNEVVSSSSFSETDKKTLINSMSIAKYSYKLWYSIYSDVDHPLNYTKYNSSNNIEPLSWAVNVFIMDILAYVDCDNNCNGTCDCAAASAYCSARCGIRPPNSTIDWGAY